MQYILKIETLQISSVPCADPQLRGLCSDGHSLQEPERPQSDSAAESQQTPWTGNTWWKPEEAEAP